MVRARYRELMAMPRDKFIREMAEGVREVELRHKFLGDDNEPDRWRGVSTPRGREAFVKAVGWRDIDDIINALEPSRGFDTLKQTWNAATPAERKVFATKYYDEISTLVALVIEYDGNF